MQDRIIYLREYRKKNANRLANYAKERLDTFRQSILLKYGARCVCCGEKETNFLTIDHVQNNGNLERLILSYKGFLAKLNTDQPDFSKYRILCWNCNVSFGMYGYCPHSSPTESVIKLKENNRRERLRVWKHKIRKSVIAIYGGKCFCCDNALYEFLALDHIDGGGRQERKIQSPFNNYTRIHKNQFKDDKFRLLCHNCNNGFARLGFCPHLCDGH